MFTEKKSFKSLALEAPFYSGTLIIMGLILIFFLLLIIFTSESIPFVLTVAMAVFFGGKVISFIPFVICHGDTKEINENNKPSSVKLTAREQLAKMERVYIIMLLVFFSVEIALLILPIFYITEKYLGQPLIRAKRWLFSPFPSFQLEK